MPYFLASVVASLLSWLVEHSLPDLPGTGIPTVVGFLVWVVAFYFAKQYLNELRR
jgi:hypothetical protein